MRNEEQAMLAKKYGREVVVLTPEEEMDILIERACDLNDKKKKFEAAEFVSCANIHQNKKNKRAGKRKREFKARRNRSVKALYCGSGLIEAESGAIHSRRGDKCRRRKNMTARELQEAIDDALAVEQELAYEETSDYEYLRWLDGEYDDYPEDDYLDDYMYEDICDSYTKGYDDGYHDGYAAAMAELRAKYA